METDVFCNEFSVKFWFFNFFDIDTNWGINDFFKLFLELVDASTLLADHGTSLSGANGDGSKVWAALNADTINSWATLEAILDSFADFDILDKPVLEVGFAGEPLAAPVLIDLETVANWVNFLTHYLFSFFSAAFGAAFLTFSSPTTSTKMFEEIFS